MLLRTVVLALLVAGCGGPTENTRDNRRLMDAILTAVTIRNSDELTKDKKLLETRHEEGDLSEKTLSAILEIIEKAEAGEWVTAERQLYDFRKQFPFPR
jgi:hypothetical protein